MASVLPPFTPTASHRKCARGGPGEVAHAVGGEAPGERAGTTSAGARRGSPISSLPRMITVVVAGARPGQPRALRGGQHLVGVPQRAGRGDDHVGGHREADVEAAVLEVELALAEYCSVFQPRTSSYTAMPRVPLRHLVDGAPRRCPRRPSGCCWRPKGNDQASSSMLLALGRQRPGEIHPHDGAVHQVGEGTAGGRVRRGLRTAARGHLEDADAALGARPHRSGRAGP